jgi:hypothetical protein
MDVFGALLSTVIAKKGVEEIAKGLEEKEKQ